MLLFFWMCLRRKKEKQEGEYEQDYQEALKIAVKDTYVCCHVLSVSVRTQACYVLHRALRNQSASCVYSCCLTAAASARSCADFPHVLSSLLLSWLLLPPPFARRAKSRLPRWWISTRPISRNGRPGFRRGRTGSMHENATSTAGRSN